MNSNPTQGMDVCVRLFCVYVVLFVGSGLAKGWFPAQGDLPTVYRIKKLKSCQGPKGCRAIERERERIDILGCRLNIWHTDRYHGVSGLLFIINKRLTFSKSGPNVWSNLNFCSSFNGKFTFSRLNVQDCPRVAYEICEQLAPIPGKNFLETGNWFIRIQCLGYCNSQKGISEILFPFWRWNDYQVVPLDTCGTDS
jgi:hypothetical protein